MAWALTVQQQPRCVLARSDTHLQHLPQVRATSKGGSFEVVFERAKSAGLLDLGIMTSPTISPSTTWALRTACTPEAELLYRPDAFLPASPSAGRRLCRALSLINFSIALDIDEEGRSGFVGRQLRKFNYGYVGEFYLAAMRETL